MNPINPMVLTVNAIIVVTAAIAFMPVAVKETESRVRNFAVIHVKSQQKEGLKRQLRSRI